MHLIYFCAFVCLAYIVSDRRRGTIHSLIYLVPPVFQAVPYWEYCDEQGRQGPCHPDGETEK